MNNNLCDLKFVISSEKFGGYRLTIKSANPELINMNDVVKQIKQNLVRDLFKLGLEHLASDAKAAKFHYHGRDELNIHGDNYICDHCE